MGREKLIDKFYADIVAKNHADQTPFLMQWFNAKGKELNELPEQYDRSGIARGDRLPIPKGKRFLALHDAVFEKLPLKYFCEVSGLNYGVARHWRKTDKIFQDVIGEYENAFSQAFLQRYTEHLESGKPEGFQQALRLIKECRHYPLLLQIGVITALHRYDKRKADEKHSMDLFNILSLHRLLYSLLLLSTGGKDQNRRREAQDLLNGRLEVFEKSFELLRKKYKSPEAQTALGVAETISYDTILYYIMIVNEFIG